MNKILIHKGNSTVFGDCQEFLTFTIDTDLDLTGWTAKFTLGWFTKEISDITTKSFEIILTAEDTKQLMLGSQYGSIILTDANGNIKTLTNRIPFEVTNEVIETGHQDIDLTIPESSGADIKLRVGDIFVRSINGMSGDVTIDIPSYDNLVTKEQLKENLATKQPVGDYVTKDEISNLDGLVTNAQLTDRLNTKQDKGNYALVEDVPTLISQLENDSNFATQTDIISAIASIPQFKLSIVDELPMGGDKMTLYFVPKQGSEDDVYNEYIWIDEIGTFEFVGSTAIDLADYVKKTDYASKNDAGVIKINTAYGFRMDENGCLQLTGANEDAVDASSNPYLMISAARSDYAVKKGITNSKYQLTDAEKSAAQSWLGIDSLSGGGSGGAVVLNDALSYGMSQYLAIDPNNDNWLKSSGQWNLKSEHAEYYNWLMDIYNGVKTVEGASVKLSTETFTDYDFVINAIDETFRLPLLNGEENLVGDVYVKSEIVTDLYPPCNGFYCATGKGKSATVVALRTPDANYGAADYTVNASDAVRVTLFVKRGMHILFYPMTPTNELFFIPAVGNGSLYFYVGKLTSNDFVTHDQLSTALGDIETLLSEV